MKKRVGITGITGFIGKHLYNTIQLYKDEFSPVLFEREWFNDDEKLDAFVSDCDVIVHLAALNRHEIPEILYETNVELVMKLQASLERGEQKRHVLMSSSTQEERDNHYGRSKKQCRNILNQWAERTGSVFTGLIIPNVFGPFSFPHYNSVIATFCHQIINKETPVIKEDGLLKLIYIGDLVDFIIECIRSEINNHKCVVDYKAEYKVSEILNLLQQYEVEYHLNGNIPPFQTVFELQLFNTFRSFIDVAVQYPRKFIQHTDSRGSFVEVIRVGTSGQVSFSTTYPGITRGNHFHTRKIERFAVIKGRALIQLREMGNSKVYEFYLDGNEPSYIDMPVWYIHNISNIGDELLYTIFWINEPFNPADPDTYFEIV